MNEIHAVSLWEAVPQESSGLYKRQSGLIIQK